MASLVSNGITFQKYFWNSTMSQMWIHLRESETDKKSDPKGCDHRSENSNFIRKETSFMWQLEQFLYSMQMLFEGPSHCLV